MLALGVLGEGELSFGALETSPGPLFIDFTRVTISHHNCEIENKICLVSNQSLAIVKDWNLDSFTANREFICCEGYIIEYKVIKYKSIHRFIEIDCHGWITYHFC